MNDDIDEEKTENKNKSTFDQEQPLSSSSSGLVVPVKKKNNNKDSNTTLLLSSLTQIQDEINNRNEIEECISDMIIDIETSINLQQQLQYIHMKNNYEKRIDEYESILEETRAVKSKTKEKHITIVNTLIQELVSLSVELSKYKNIQQQHEQLLIQYDEIIAKLFQTEEELQDIKEKYDKQQKDNRNNNHQNSNNENKSDNIEKEVEGNEIDNKKSTASVLETKTKSTEVLESNKSEGKIEPTVLASSSAIVPPTPTDNIIKTESTPTFIEANTNENKQQKAVIEKSTVEQDTNTNKSPEVTPEIQPSMSYETSGSNDVIVALVEDDNDAPKKFHEFDTEILMKIFAFLDAMDILNTAQINVSMYSRVDALFGLLGDDSNNNEDNSTIATNEIVESPPPPPPQQRKQPQSQPPQQPQPQPTQQPQQHSQPTVVALPPAKPKSTAAGAPSTKPTTNTATSSSTTVVVPPKQRQQQDVGTVVQIPTMTTASTPKGAITTAATTSKTITPSPATSTQSATKQTPAATSSSTSRHAPSKSADSSTSSIGRGTNFFSGLIPPLRTNVTAGGVGAAAAAAAASSTTPDRKSPSAAAAAATARGGDGPPMSKAMANSMASKLTDSELNAIIMMTERLKTKESLVAKLQKQNDDLTSKLDGTEAVKQFLIAKVRDMEITISSSVENEMKIAQQIVTDQEVIAFLDGKVQELEYNIKQLNIKQNETQKELELIKRQTQQKITVLNDMLQYEREKYKDMEREWKTTKKVLIKEVKNCHTQIITLQAERDGYYEQINTLRKSIITT